MATQAHLASANPFISGGTLDDSETGVYNGMLAMYSSGKLVKATSPEAAVGIFWDKKVLLDPITAHLETDVNKLDSMAGKPVGLVAGDVTFVVDSTLFESVTGLTVDDRITASNSAPGKYLIATSTDLVLGQVVEVLTDQYDTSLWAVRFSLPANQVLA